MLFIYFIDFMCLAFKKIKDGDCWPMTTKIQEKKTTHSGYYFI